MLTWLTFQLTTQVLNKIYTLFTKSIKNVSGFIASGVFLCLCLILLPAQLLASPQAKNFQPFETRDQNLFNLLHGQALPSNAHLNKTGQSRWSNTLAITNAINIESNNNESIYLDYEAYRYNFSYQYGVNENWNIKLDIPLIHQTGGFLDSAINNWHDALNLPQSFRPLVEDDQYEVSYSYQNQSMIDLDESSTSLGDIQIALAHSLVESSETTMSVWGSLKLPTGDKEKLSGSGAADLSVWLALNQQLSEDWLINVNSGAVFLGKDKYQDIPLSDYALYGHVMLGWLVTDSIDLKVQLQGHSSYYDESELKILGGTYFLTFGTSINISECQQLDFAVSEDIKTDASPDATFLISWRGYSDC